ncbi:MAG: hypothetical protein KatS3mg061_3447 [Dehalococcoidia bacterium]|nr:MAG: hypothetical protein KatS3mg061_3447 [Dehalococcoidia bacterium]
MTVHLDDPDSLTPMLAIDLAQPGDVIVVAAQGRMECSAGVGDGTPTREPPPLERSDAGGGKPLQALDLDAHVATLPIGWADGPAS